MRLTRPSSPVRAAAWKAAKQPIRSVDPRRPAGATRRLPDSRRSDQVRKHRQLSAAQQSLALAPRVSQSVHLLERPLFSDLNTCCRLSAVLHRANLCCIYAALVVRRPRSPNSRCRTHTGHRTAQVATAPSTGPEGKPDIHPALTPSRSDRLLECQLLWSANLRDRPKAVFRSFDLGAAVRSLMQEQLSLEVADQSR